MTKQQKSIRKETTLSSVPTVRRHVYFYIVLFLGTTLLHQTVWKSSPPDAAAAAIAAGERVAEVQHELVMAEQQFAP